MRYFIYLSYKGTNYHGWQMQANARTVQGEVNRALSLLLNEKIETTGAGRTDTGVHASYFVAHFDSGQYELYVAANGTAQTLYKLNCILPGDICIHDILHVEATAHARFDAVQRTYKYYISTEKNPFNTEFAAFFPFELNVAAMNDAAQLLFEYTDFTSFAKLHGQSKTNRCRIIQARWEATAGGLEFTISADRFLRNMVRAIVGTLIDVGRGKITRDDLRHIITRKNRCAAGSSVPAKGLWLTGIQYKNAPNISRGIDLPVII
ncbi:MAG: tRNA pseudouridine(38-40) synthase TruA [Prevotellaceae bacterium]|jgi:tRNA pseudouridine38-40 synthase|nr:tRNA pseudouridine(38-40) synthase TruA [Prevotellaceae bacterium]